MYLNKEFSCNIRINLVEVDETKIVALAATNAPGVLGVVQGVHREAILHC